MIHSIELKVPLDVKINYGSNWDSLESLKIDL